MKAVFAVLGFMLLCFTIIYIADSKYKSAAQDSHSRSFCGELTGIKVDKLKSGVPIVYYTLRASNDYKVFSLHYSVSKKDRQILLVNKKLCFDYYYDMFLQPTVLRVTEEK